MKLSVNAQGASMMALGMAGFTVSDALVKGVTGHLHIVQIMVLRGIFIVLFLSTLVVAYKQHRFIPSQKVLLLIFARSSFDLFATVVYFIALSHMALSGTIAVMQILPLSVTLAGAIFLKEPIGWRSILAILIGLIGVNLVIKPGTDSFNFYAIFAILTVLGVTGRDLTSRMLPANVPSLYVACINGYILTAAALIALPFFSLEPVGTPQIGFLVGAALASCCGYIFSVAAMRVGEIATVSLFRFSALIVALILGYFFFNEWPDSWSWLGIILIVASGGFALRRRGMKRMRAKAQARRLRK